MCVCGVCVSVCVVCVCVCVVCVGVYVRVCVCEREREREMKRTITVDVCKHRCCLFKKPVQLGFDIRQRITRTPINTVADLLGFAKYG